MSMSMTIKTISDSDIVQVKENPLKINIIHYDEIFEEDIEDLDDDEQNELINWKPQNKSIEYHIVGLFEALNYLLTEDPKWGGGSFPLNFLGEKGFALGEIGWGPARIFISNEVKEIFKELKELDFNHLINFYNADSFNQNDIYPKGYVWKSEDGSTLVEKIKTLVTFIGEAVDKNLGIYITIE